MNVADETTRANASKLQHCSKQQYSTVSEDFYQPELGNFHTYGIQVITPNCTNILHDVSVCKETTGHIVELLNRYQVSPIHLYDIITDMLP